LAWVYEADFEWVCGLRPPPRGGPTCSDAGEVVEGAANLDLCGTRKYVEKHASKLRSVRKGCRYGEPMRHKRPKRRIVLKSCLETV